MSTALPSTLPILDLARLNAGPADRAAFLDHLRYAARDIGFFYVVNHGVDTRLLEDVQREARQFFALPEEEKAQVAMIHSPHFRAGFWGRPAPRGGGGGTDARQAGLARAV
ncbi:2-Oxobutyrate oxidase, putative [Cronobacter sakazakii 701]|nr:2-Oxobutyrate oxidase, putative [Cronobacter sakazakii 701]